MAVTLDGVFVKIVKWDSSTDWVLKNVSLSVGKGTIYALCGPSGSGKTTVCLTILGLTKVSHGRVDLSPLDQKSVQIPGKDVGFMPQDLSVHPYMTGREIIEYFAMVHNMPKHAIRERCNELLHLLDLKELEGKRIKFWSEGQKRRISLACALVQSPSLLILDEPTVGVDPILREKIWAYLENLVHQTGTTVIITTHYLQEAERTDKVGFMRNGTILAEGPPKMLKLSFNSAASLDTVFHELCIKDELAPIVGVSPSHQQKKEHPRRTMSSPWLISSVKALLFKDKKHIKRHTLFLLFQTVLPMIVFLIFYASIGRPLDGLRIGFVNNDNAKCVGDESSISCPSFETIIWEGTVQVAGLNNLSCLVLTSLGSKVQLVEVMTSEAACQGVYAGKLHGCVIVPEGFSSSFVKRFVGSLEGHVPKADIEVRLDTTNQLVTQAVQRAIYEAVQNALLQLATSCGFHGSEFPGGIAVTTSTGDMSFGLNMMPGVVVVVLHLMAFALTADQLVSEKEAGLLQRQVACGLSLQLTLLCQLLVHLVVIIPQIISSVVLLCLLFGRGYSWEAVSALAVVCLVQACCGMCFGLMVTSLCSNRDQVIQVGIGSVLPTFVLAGVIWPREGMPHALNILSQALPVPLSCDLARSLMTTTTIDDVPLEKMGFGICVPILWSVAFLVICNYRIRRWGLLG